MALFKILSLILCWTVLIGSSRLHGGNEPSVAGYSDPLQPPEADEVPVAPSVPFYRIPARMEQVALQIEKQQRSLGALSPPQHTKQFDSFGYHSDYLPAVKGVPGEPLWTLDFDYGIPSRRILGVVMIPTFDERSPEVKGYAFPKRFRIRSTTRDGAPRRVLVDWTAKDFPDPGMRPVIFRFPSEYAANPETISRKGLRLEVFAGHEEDGLEFCSLARFHLIRQDELHWPKQTKVSSSFESAPYWAADYLAASRHTLGMPLSAKKGEGGDLIMNLPASRLKEPLTIRVELDEPTRVGWLNFFPGHSPDGIDVPGYGFPRSVQISCLVEQGTTGTYRRIPVEGLSIPQNPGNNMIRLTDFPAREVVAVEIACNDFPVYQGQAVFALGEIEILSKGQNISRGRPITFHQPELEEVPDLNGLVDGRVNGRNVLNLLGWFDQMAAGKSPEARLAVLEKEHSHLVERWTRIRQRSVACLIVLIITAILIFVFIMFRSRTRAELRLRRQINSDLHDEVGSNLGSISLMAGQLEGFAGNGRMKDGLVDLALMAREASASLREVVWLVDQKTIRLPGLIRKLGERAERVLKDVELIVEIPEDVPDVEVSLTCKRHLIMFFKEAVHNCARHAQASKVRVAASVAGRELQILICDNGCGFDTSETSSGWGRESMKERAQEIGGKMELVSHPGEGTRIVLKIPLVSLSKEPNKSYKTSN